MGKVIDFGTYLTKKRKQSTTSIEQLWNYVKIYYPQKDYIQKHIVPIGITLPILKNNSSSTDTILEYVKRRCDGCSNVALSSRNNWMAHVLCLCVPKLEEVLTELTRRGLMTAQTETIILTSIYQSAIEINPGLNWKFVHETISKTGM